MPRRFASGLFAAFVLSASGISAAAPADCPDGWFCEPNAPPPPSAEPPPPSPPPRPEANQPNLPVNGPVNGPGGSAPPPGSILVAPPPANAPSSEEPPARKRRHRFREWGFNLHLEGAWFSEQPADDAAAGGLGFAFRYRAFPSLAFEAGVDFVRGAEHRGYWRSDTALLLNTLLFFNPRDVAQVYALGGLGFSRSSLNYARHTGDDVFYARSDEHQSYFGGHLGLGLEVRVSRRIAVGGDVIGFIRARTDDSNSTDFVSSAARRPTDTSGGAVRAGVTFYW